MTPQDAYCGNITIGDKVRFEGGEYVVYDLISTSPHGDRMLVEIALGKFVSITEVEKI